MNELVTRKDLAVYAQNILDFLEKRQITQPIDLARAIMKSRLENQPTHHIDVEMRPSEQGTSASLSYIIDGSGVPIETRLNTQRGYANVTVRGNFKMDGYIPYSKDQAGNMAQEKRLINCTIDSLKKELEYLASA